jgi:hypothetical protein
MNPAHHAKHWPADRLEPRKVAQLVPYARNARTHSEAQVAQLAASIREWGWTNPVIVDPANNIIAGHGRVLAAQKLGIEEVPCVVAEGWTEAQKRAYIVADNKLAMNAGWDEELLALEFEELRQLDFDLSLTGFDEDEILGLKMGEEAEGADDVPEVQEHATTQAGDVWRMGPHRVMCGDALDEAHRGRLMAGETPGVTVLDPPYELADPKWVPFISDPCIVFGQARQIRRIPDALWRFERVVAKRYKHRSATVQIAHEHAFVAQCGSVKTLPKTSETFPSIVQQEIEREHEHAKPVSLLVEHLTHWTPPWSLVFDPFLGSGTTLIAAEQMGRKCYGMEISPQYCDVIVRRWEKLTGKSAVLESTGETFAERGGYDEAQAQH